MADPIPDFTQEERHAVTRILLERCMRAHPVHGRVNNLLSDGLSAVADGGKRVARV